MRLPISLLLFLLIHHRERFEVLRVIELFIETIWGELTFLDFKKTKTGVTRCSPTPGSPRTFCAIMAC